MRHVASSVSNWLMSLPGVFALIVAFWLLGDWLSLIPWVRDNLEAHGKLGDSFGGVAAIAAAIALVMTAKELNASKQASRDQERLNAMSTLIAACHDAIREGRAGDERFVYHNKEYNAAQLRDTLVTDLIRELERTERKHTR